MSTVADLDFATGFMLEKQHSPEQQEKFAKVLVGQKVRRTVLSYQRVQRRGERCVEETRIDLIAGGGRVAAKPVYWTPDEAMEQVAFHVERGYQVVA
jgi:hypothetical protein